MKILRDEALCSEGKSLLPALDGGRNYQGKGAVFYQVVFMMIIRILRIWTNQRAYGMWSWDVTKRMMAYRWIPMGGNDDDDDGGGQ